MQVRQHGLSVKVAEKLRRAVIRLGPAAAGGAWASAAAAGAAAGPAWFPGDSEDDPAVRSSSSDPKGFVNAPLPGPPSCHHLTLHDSPHRTPIPARHIMLHTAPELGGGGGGEAGGVSRGV